MAYHVIPFCLLLAALTPVSHTADNSMDASSESDEEMNTPQGQCRNKRPNCLEMSERNGGRELFCQRRWARNKCNKLCGICGDVCINIEPRCTRMSEKNGKQVFCRRPWAKRSCKKMCGRCEVPPTNCPNPLQVINPDGSVSLVCESIPGGGNWVIFQRRVNGDVSFSRDWGEYKSGFGDVTSSGDFWLGLETVNRLCGGPEDHCELRIDMNHNGSSAFARYNTFYISPESGNYRLTIAGYSGDAGDSLEDQNGMEFSTPDRDHDNSAGDNCAGVYESAWWYSDCGHSDLNSLWQNTADISLFWQQLTGGFSQLQSSEMMLRRSTYVPDMKFCM